MRKQYLLEKEDFVKTFDSFHQSLLDDYFSAKVWMDRGFRRAEIIQKTGISEHRLSNWIRKEKSVPSSVKCLLKAQKRGYFSVSRASKDAEKLAYLVGYCLGDGNIHRKLCNTWFYGHSDDLPVFNELLESFSVRGQIHVYKIHNGKMCISDNAFTRFMMCLGCTVGDKTKSDFSVPKWILDTENQSELKRKFLQGLCDSELSNIKLIFKNRFAFQSLKFYSIKTKNQVDSGIFYLNQLRKLISEFGVSTTDVKIDRLYTRSRDNSTMVQLYFVIHSNYINLNKFIQNIGFLHNTERKNQMMKYSRRIGVCAKKELDKISKYEKSLQMRKKGLSAYKIAQKLDLPIHNVKNWLYRKNKPMSYHVINKN
ncbi:MAG: hypothetical protein ABIJ92_01880 [Candidatus Aenigmatarchaeota archaeon]